MGGCRRWMLAARGMIVRILHQRQNCLRALFLDECRSGVSLTLRETPQLIEKVHQSVVFSADERVYTIGGSTPEFNAGLAERRSYHIYGNTAQ